METTIAPSILGRTYTAAPSTPDTTPENTTTPGGQESRTDAPVSSPYIFFSFLKLSEYFFWVDTCHFMAPLILLYLGFKARMSNIIHTWRKRMASNATSCCSPHTCFSRGRMPDSIDKPPALQSNALTTRSPASIPHFRNLLIEVFVFE